MPDIDLRQPDIPLLGLWMSVSEIAASKNLARQSVSERVARLEAQGLVSTRPGKGRQKLVNLAEYDRAVGETTDGIRSINGCGSSPPSVPLSQPSGDDPVLAREQARRVSYQADIAKLDLDERLKRLLPADEMAAAIGEAAEIIVRCIEQLPTRADEVAAAVGKEGAIGARTILKTIANDLRRAVDVNLRRWAEENIAPPPIPESAT